MKEDGIWKIQYVHITPLIVADYYIGSSTGGVKPLNTYTPPFVNVTGNPMALERTFSRTANSTLEDLERRLRHTQLTMGLRTNLTRTDTARRHRSDATWGALRQEEAQSCDV
jgi:hypothetical protein